MNWAQIWIDLFGTTEWLGLNMGFWVANGVVLVIVIIMNVIFWSMKPLPMPTNSKSKVNGFPRSERPNLDP